MDVTINKAIADIIAKYTSNKEDIREITLQKVNFHNAEKILDLGCGFGFLTKNLKNKAPKNIEITGIDQCVNNKQYFLDSCTKNGFQGKFIKSDMSVLNEFKADSYDFILCSYALYFFPEVIPKISQLLKNDGKFVVITHVKNHLVELISYIKNIKRKNKSETNINTPYEKLISNFSDENAFQLLSPYFKNIQKFDYKSSLVFSKNEISDLIIYLQLKHSFYVNNDKQLLNKVIKQLKKDIHTMKKIIISKDDVIFICSKKFEPNEK